MSQSSYIAGGLVLGFIMFLAARGRLKAYGDALFGASPGASSGSSGGKSSGPLGDLTDALGTAGKVASTAAALGIAL